MELRSFGKSNFPAQARKRKIDLGKIEISNYIFFLKKSFSYISGNQNFEEISYILLRKPFLIAWEMETPKKPGTFRQKV